LREIIIFLVAERATPITSRTAIEELFSVQKRDVKN